MSLHVHEVKEKESNYLKEKERKKKENYMQKQIRYTYDVVMLTSQKQRFQ